MKVEFQNVTYRRKNFCLKDLSFQVREGYLTALIGKNGAGKTTLFHLFAGSGREIRGYDFGGRQKLAPKSGRTPESDWVCITGTEVFYGMYGFGKCRHDAVAV